MNGIEQRNHRKRTEQLADDLGSLSSATFDAVIGLERKIDAAKDEAHEAVRLAWMEQRGYVDGLDAAIWREFAAFRGLGFWGRMRWIVRGY